MVEGSGSGRRGRSLRSRHRRGACRRWGNQVEAAAVGELGEREREERAVLNGVGIDAGKV